MYIQTNSELFNQIDLGLKKAIKKALLHHKELGNSIHILVNNKIIEVPPEQIKIDKIPSEER